MLLNEREDPRAIKNTTIKKSLSGNRRELISCVYGRLARLIPAISAIYLPNLLGRTVSPHPAPN